MHLPERHARDDAGGQTDGHVVEAGAQPVGPLSRHVLDADRLVWRANRHLVALRLRSHPPGERAAHFFGTDPTRILLELVHNDQVRVEGYSGSQPRRTFTVPTCFLPRICPGSRRPE